MPIFTNMSCGIQQGDLEAFDKRVGGACRWLYNNNCHKIILAMLRIRSCKEKSCKEKADKIFFHAK